MFLVPAGAAITQPRLRITPPRQTAPIWILLWLALTLLIGFRLEVGGDWGSYEKHVYHASYLSFSEVLTSSDPGYGLLNWLSWHLGWGVYGVNLVCGGLFSLGLIVFCRQQPRPWLAMAVAVPYLVIVVAMGYSRQGVAVGLGMLGLAALSRKSNLRFVLWVSLAVLFHKTAVILFPIAIAVTKRGRWWTAAWVGSTAALAYVLFLEEHTADLVQGYLLVEYASEGAAIRIAMNALPAAIFLAFRRQMAPDEHIRRIWTWVAFAALATVLLLIISPSSTAIDRVALYFIPVQLFVFSRLPDLGGRDRAITATNTFGVIAFYGLVQAVWLNFAVHASYWLPYRFYLFEY